MTAPYATGGIVRPGSAIVLREGDCILPPMSSPVWLAALTMACRPWRCLPAIPPARPYQEDQT